MLALARLRRASAAPTASNTFAEQAGAVNWQLRRRLLAFLPAGVARLLALALALARYAHFCYAKVCTRSAKVTAAPARYLLATCALLLRKSERSEQEQEQEGEQRRR